LARHAISGSQSLPPCDSRRRSPAGRTKGLLTDSAIGVPFLDFCQATFRFLIFIREISKLDRQYSTREEVERCRADFGAVAHHGVAGVSIT
jgi:hypothetical protein